MTTRPRALLLGAHPDDLETYAGATMLALAEAGFELHLVLATRGERGTLQPKRGTRLDEQGAAIAMLGDGVASLTCWDLADAGLDAQRAELDRRCEELAEQECDLFLAPHPEDPHRDHAALAASLPETARTWRWLPACSSAAGRDAAERGADEPVSRRGPGVDLSRLATHALPFETFEAKAALIRCHASQIPGEAESRAHLPRGLDILERAHERDRAFGERLGLSFAEPLVGWRGTREECVLRETLGLVDLSAP